MEICDVRCNAAQSLNPHVRERVDVNRQTQPSESEVAFGSSRGCS